MREFLSYDCYKFFTIINNFYLMFLYKNIITILNTLQIPYKEIEHEASTSCDHSKELRKKEWLEWIGSKNIVFHAKGKFYLVTTLWDKDIKARNFKHEFGTKDIRFASQEEITNILWATIGSIPPFGFENESIPLFIDEEIFTYEYFCFNPWIPTKSIQIMTQDLKKIYLQFKNQVKIFDFSNEEEKKIYLLEE